MLEFQRDTFALVERLHFLGHEDLRGVIRRLTLRLLLFGLPPLSSDFLILHVFGKTITITHFYDSVSFFLIAIASTIAIAVRINIHTLMTIFLKRS